MNKNNKTKNKTTEIKNSVEFPQKMGICHSSVDRAETIVGKLENIKKIAQMQFSDTKK